MKISPEHHKPQTMELYWEGEVLIRFQDLQRKLEDISEPQQRLEIADKENRHINQSIFNFVRFSVKGNNAYGINHDPKGPGSYTTPLSDLWVNNTDCKG